LLFWKSTFDQNVAFADVGARKDLQKTTYRRLLLHAFAVLYFLTMVLMASIAFAGEEAPKPEEQGSSPPTPRFHQTVTVLAQPIESAGAALTVVESKAIVSRGMTTLSGVLQEVAGLHVTESGSRTGVTTVEIRGGDPTHTLVLLDGVPLNDGTSSLGDVQENTPGNGRPPAPSQG
jgi:outer membrane receptor for ferrienterochelin and colicin